MPEFALFSGPVVLKNQLLAEYIEEVAVVAVGCVAIEKRWFTAGGTLPVADLE